MARTLRSVDGWLRERGLLLDLEPADLGWYRSYLHRDQRVYAEGHAPGVAAALDSLFEDADLRQRQEGIRWSLEPNRRAPASTAEVDDELDGRRLTVSSGVEPDGQPFYMASVEGFGYSHAPSFEEAVLAALLDPERAESFESKQRRYEQLLGASEPMIEAPGRERRQVPLRQLTQAEAQAAFAEHGSARAAAEALGLPRRTFEALLKGTAERGGVPRSAAMVSRGRAITADEAKRALVKTGSVIAAAHELGVDRNTLRSFLDRAGIREPRPPNLPRVGARQRRAAQGHLVSYEDAMRAIDEVGRLNAPAALKISSSVFGRLLRDGPGTVIDAEVIA